MAWEMYLRMESTHESFIMLQILANDCYRAGHFFYSLKAFDVLERLDPAPECAQPPIFQYSHVKFRLTGEIALKRDAGTGRGNEAQQLACFRKSLRERKIARHSLKLFQC